MRILSGLSRRAGKRIQVRMAIFSPLFLPLSLLVHLKAQPGHGTATIVADACIDLLAMALTFIVVPVKPRHAAALALVGWYLMAPPSVPSDPNTPDLSAPLGKWEVRETLTTQAQCEKYKAALEFVVHDPSFQEYGAAIARKQSRPWDIERARAFTDFQKCVASDDPRLKGN